MTRVVGVDGAPGGWAVVAYEAGRCFVHKAATLDEIADDQPRPKIIAIDVPIGLLDTYQIGGRDCDREARKYLGSPRGSSVFPAPVRTVLGATSYKDACARSLASGAGAKAISRQTFEIRDKIAKVDDLLRARSDLLRTVYEVHPEVCFRELAGRPMKHSKKSPAGRVERKEALGRYFADIEVTLADGKKAGLRDEDIFDAAVACWSAIRLAEGRGRSLVESIPRDKQGLTMTIWV